jgi:hypothetical protein
MAVANDNKREAPEAEALSSERIKEMSDTLRSARESFTALQDVLRRMKETLS